MRQKIYTAVQAVVLSLFMMVSVSCAHEADKYDKICDIYAGIVNKPISLSEKEGSIADGVMKSYPDFFKKEFSHIAQVDSDKRYAMLKQVIESVSKKSWDCPVARNYYETEFGK